MGTSNLKRIWPLNVCTYAVLADFAFGMFWCSLDINAGIIQPTACVPMHYHRGGAADEALLLLATMRQLCSWETGIEM